MPPASRSLPVGLLRLVHPFPILLDGAATTAIALAAGGDGGVSVRLGLAMLALQASIGALNDLVDAPVDAGRKPGKPIPTGMVQPAIARAVVAGSAGLGLALAASAGLGPLVLAGAGLAIGYAYDLVAKGTAWSWLPFAMGLPLLPVFAWIGATGALPAPFAVLVPAAIMAGAALAIANAMADVGRDESAAIGSVAVRLGARRAWGIGAVLQLGVVVIAIGSMGTSNPSSPAIVGAALATGVVALGLRLGRASSPAILERAWEVQSIGVALLGISWLVGMAGPG